MSSTSKSQQIPCGGLVDTVAALEPTFGGINLEDIKAPECFEIEQQLRERMNIPVFHDDQHGTAIIVGAAVTQCADAGGKDIAKVKIVASGAGRRHSPVSTSW
jgi:malate dehydrogenase (oxaloacetate-decarboxylating)(NADP+)